MNEQKSSLWITESTRLEKTCAMESHLWPNHHHLVTECHVQSFLKQLRGQWLHQAPPWSAHSNICSPCLRRNPPDVQPKPPLVSLRLQWITTQSYDYFFYVKVMHQGAEFLPKVLWNQTAQASTSDNQPWTKGRWTGLASWLTTRTRQHGAQRLRSTGRPRTLYLETSARWENPANSPI